MENVKIHSSSVISKDCKFIGNVVIGKNCTIEHCEIKDSVIADNCVIKNSQIEDSEISSGCNIGPFARIRPNCKVGNNVKIGNFVELKNAIIGSRTKIPHLSYVGDCEIGSDVNIGCGVIFCNYDGKDKYKSFVGDRVFIGSNSNIIAPVVIENDSFISAGTTVTHDVLKKQFCIGRVRNEMWKNNYNPYAQNFLGKLKYFGTNGIRGIVGEDFNEEFFVKLGYAISKLQKNAKILIARDTRPSGVMIKENLAKGLCFNKTKVYDAGIISTGALCYLTKTCGFDYGIMITASHNPSEYNGIKIFDKKGYKINENQEFFIEKHIKMPKNMTNGKIQSLSTKPYFDYLNSLFSKLNSSISVFLDCANGATSEYAKKLFEQLGYNVKAINISGEINKNASVLDNNVFEENFKKSNCDIGFCFDGDGDRVMFISKKYGLFDGNKLLYLFAKYYKQKFVVGTIMTNYAIEKILKKHGIRLFRAKVGDRNIARLLKKKDYLIGAEESGHIIIKKYLTTGDGLLNALNIAQIFTKNERLFEDTSKIKLLPVYKKKIETKNKEILKDPSVQNVIKMQNEIIKTNGRIIVRPSGTEPIIRITVESEDEILAQNVIKNIADAITNKLEKV